MYYSKVQKHDKWYASVSKSNVPPPLPHAQWQHQFYILHYQYNESDKNYSWVSCVSSISERKESCVFSKQGSVILTDNISFSSANCK